MEHYFLIHDRADSVGVAVQDIHKGDKVIGAFLHSDDQQEVMANDDIKLGHKIALKNIKNGDFVYEYKEKIGIATQDIKIGDLVHIHNIKTARW